MKEVSGTSACRGRPPLVQVKTTAAQGTHPQQPKVPPHPVFSVDFTAGGGSYLFSRRHRTLDRGGASRGGVVAASEATKAGRRRDDGGEDRGLRTPGREARLQHRPGRRRFADSSFLTVGGEPSRAPDRGPARDDRRGHRRRRSGHRVPGTAPSGTSSASTTQRCHLIVGRLKQNAHLRDGEPEIAPPQAPKRIRTWRADVR